MLASCLRFDAVHAADTSLAVPCSPGSGSSSAPAARAPAVAAGAAAAQHAAPAGGTLAPAAASCVWGVLPAARHARATAMGHAAPGHASSVRLPALQRRTPGHAPLHDAAAWYAGSTARLLTGCSAPCMHGNERPCDVWQRAPAPCLAHGTVCRAAK
ncbi:hypothetical protein COO60DRAFT_502771 [Scenedesmus sp. NREL 46B-D3]|nr:hypothetical protein COO60DRAFT_502771 [Scenedesmus sp. NREL 46B-D3]